ncbi:T9SS type A sorting domain-containing protein [Cecembia lonarensis]|uniref:Secretion system C-terminal sorting domain-containing protein n=1 Tax=Cecembia lonarensis (strain CCUG 58316 / KCTC 22772 / LW9) TaxID=1225176 RepID=K1KZA3_CECL9|nr:T9SS type A sorting domain-containing protein [Cecembia lonarensis]EKB47806.1 hypothetical protein B879_03585 [Cecembia lonarensis LW9]
MRLFYFITLFLFNFLALTFMVSAQITYTSQPCSSGLWSDAACWTRTGTCSGNVTVPNVPPFQRISNNCAVVVNLNHPRTINGDMATGDGFTLNMNASLTINGNLTSSNSGATKFNVFAGVLTAQVVEVKNDFDLIIHDGAEAIFDELDLNGRNVTIDVRAGGSLTVLGETKMRGNRSDILVAGSFETGSIDVAGATNNITTSGGANVYVSDPEGGITIAGNATLNITGASEVVVEGSVEVKGGNLNVTETASLTIYTDFLVNGGSTINITTQGEVYVCGMRPEPEEISNIDDDAIYEILDDPILCNFSIMPVSYLYFESEFESRERKVTLSWATANENGNSHFEVQRTMTGVNDFETIAEVQGMGWKDSKTEYTFIDKEIPLAGGNGLYRLKQVDFEGNEVFYKVISVRIPSVETTQGVWRVFPNPTNGDRLNFELVDPRQYGGQEIQIVLISPSANPIILSGKNTKDLSSQIHEKIANAPKGVYLLQVSWGNKNEQIRVLKH